MAIVLKDVAVNKVVSNGLAQVVHIVPGHMRHRLIRRLLVKQPGLQADRPVKSHIPVVSQHQITHLCLILKWLVHS